MIEYSKNKIDKETELALRRSRMAAGGEGYGQEEKVLTDHVIEDITEIPGFYTRHQITSQDTTRLFLTSDSTRPLNNYQKELFDIWNKYHFSSSQKFKFLYYDPR